MTRGRGPQIHDSDLVLVTTSSARRSFKEDDDFDDDPSFISTKAAKRISNQINDDFDTMQRRSRRQDKILLSDYSPKLQMETYDPERVRQVHYGRSHSSAVDDFGSSYRPKLKSYDDFDTGRPVTIRKPYDQTDDASPRFFERMLENVFGYRGTGSGPENRTPVSSGFHLDDAFADDEFVGYSRPRSQHYGGAPAGYGYVPSVTHVAPYVQPVSHVSHVSHASPPRHRRRGSSLPPPIGGHHGRSSYSPSHAVVIRESRETDSVPLSRAPASMSSLRYAAADAKNKLDVHKSMMDRYLPIYLGPENEVQYEVDYKFGELVQRMPSLDPYRPGARAAGLDSYKPSLTPRAQQGSNAHLQPKVSQARRRAREVLCRTKGDPHYYS